MKRFACGDVVPDCIRTFNADTDSAIVRAVLQHAEVDHGMATVPAATLQQIREHIRAA